MSELSTPYQHKHKKRKEALIDRYRLIAPPQLQLDYDNAKYQRTDPKHTIYDNGTIRYPYTLEVLAIPIKNPNQNKSIIISGVNYSTSINNRSYFSADSYKSGYSWDNKSGIHLSALNIEEIVKVSSAQRRFEKYERYKYIYDNFEYLTGSSLDIVMENITEDNSDTLDNYEKDAITELLRDRDPMRARRIELDSVIKVVRGNLFAEFVLKKLQEFFPARNYNRAIKLPTEYFADKFHILPERIKQLFLRYVEIAERAAKPTEEKIEDELEHWSPSDEEIQQGIPVLLKKHDEDALNEMLTSKAVTDDPEMQALDKKAGELLESLPHQN
jgi:hypothetical protein